MRRRLLIMLLKLALLPTPVAACETGAAHAYHQQR
jgi:hypothetical protein